MDYSMQTILYLDRRKRELSGCKTDKTEDVIVKLVNVTGADKTFAVDIANAGEISDEADVDVVQGTVRQMIIFSEKKKLLH